MFTVICTIIAMIGFRITLKAKSLRLVKFYHYIATVKFVRKKFTKFYGLDIVMAFTKLIFIFRAISFVIKDKILIVIIRVIRRVSVTWT